MLWIWAVRNMIALVVLTLIIVAAASWLPGYLNRVQVPPEYEDIQGLPPMTGVWLAPAPWFAGDILAYRHGGGPDDVGFGFVAGLPGDVVRVAEGKLTVNGQSVPDWKDMKGSAVLGPVVVPAGHVFVHSQGHRRDSMAFGMISPDMVLGKVRR
jgi:hypothetical protein